MNSAVVSLATEVVDAVEVFPAYCGVCSELRYFPDRVARMWWEEKHAHGGVD